MNFEIHRFFFTGKLTRQQNKNAKMNLYVFIDVQMPESSQ